MPKSQSPETVILARIAVRGFDYVGGDTIPIEMDADMQMQVLCRAAFKVLGGEKVAREIAKAAEPLNVDGRSNERRRKGRPHG